MNFLKSLYRKLFGIKTGVYLMVDREAISWARDSTESERKAIKERVRRLTLARPAYDPSTDENKIMNGEVESYFE